MTNENAINVLRHLSPPHTSKAAFDAFRQAIAIAIEALEEPQIIRCKDCKHYKYGMCMKICANKSTNGFCDWGER